MGDETRRLLRRQEQYDVIVHVYDLIEEINTYTHVLGMGIYHSSVEVHGYEWAYGGHEIPGQTGVYAVRASSMPRTPGERIGTGEQQYVYRASYPMGTTRLSKDEVEGVIRDMGREEYQGTRYHILQHNWYGLTIGRRILVLDRASFRAFNRLVCATDDLTLTCAHKRSRTPDCPFTCCSNHFTSDLCVELTGVGAPGWINRIANIAVRLHCLVPAGYLPDLIETRGRAAAQQIAQAEDQRD